MKEEKDAFGGWDFHSLMFHATAGWTASSPVCNLSSAVFLRDSEFTAPQLVQDACLALALRARYVFVIIARCVVADSKWTGSSCCFLKCLTNSHEQVRARLHIKTAGGNINGCFRADAAI